VPLRVQPIYADNPGALANAVYTLPPSLDLELSSVRARVDGAAASGAFIVVCEVLTNDGRLLAQSPISQEYAVGDTGANTWAPFLRADQASTPSGATELPWARISRGFDAGVQSIGNNSFTTIVVNHDYNMGAGESGADWFHRTGNTLVLEQDAVVLMTAEMTWSSSVSTAFLFGLSTLGGTDWNPLDAKGASTSTTMTAVYTRVHRLNAGDDVSMLVWQISGGARDLDAAYLEAVVLGTWTGTNYTAMAPAQ
jgi:hypothetical protein